ncbi:MAG: methyl-accepting chemotaxis protein [Treponema sp.]|nr:methyl-accepting chemotaxis protein [Treponema sp.]
MTIRKSLFLSTFISIFIGFLLSSVIMLIIQTANKKKEIQSEINRLTEMVCTTNVAYAWSYDTIGLQQSIDAMIKDPEIVYIEIHDVGDMLLGVAEDEKKGNIFEVEQNLEMDGYPVGHAKIEFTDHNITQRYISDMIMFLLFELLLFVIVIITVMLSTGYFVKRPIIKLTDIVKDMAQGEGDLTVRIPVVHRNELAVLSNYFNQFLEKLHLSVSNIINVGAASESLGENLDCNTEELSISIEDLSKNMNEVNSRITYMDNEIKTSEQNVSRINGFINSVADMINEQSVSVERSSAAIGDMVTSITEIESLTAMKLSKVEVLEKEAAKLEIETKKNVAQMNSASESTKEIISMVSVINNIAARTNLLAMNAAIEAAHAGTAGKGFSVVAGEIRKLAEQTAKNSRNIEASVSEIVEEIDSATKSSQDSSQILSTVLEEISDVAVGLNDTLNSLKNISTGNARIIESLEELNSITNSVTSSSNEMRRGTNEITNSISTIMSITSESKQEIDAMAQNLNKVSDAMVDLTHLSKDNSNNIENLEQEIKKFKL